MGGFTVTGTEKGHFVRLENIRPNKQAHMLALNKAPLMRSNPLSIQTRAQGKNRKS